MPLERARLLRVVRKALRFDGEDDYVSIPYTSISIDPPITFEIVVLVREIADYKVFFRKYDYPSPGIKRGIRFDTGENNNLRIEWGDGESSASKWIGCEMRINMWYHFVITHSGEPDNILNFYVNGSLEHTYEGTPLADAPVDLWIGDSSSPVYGYIAIFRIYSRALSDSEVEWNYYHPDNPVRNGLVLWLHWDSIDTDNNVWRDKSGYGNDGTINGATEVDWLMSPVRSLSPTREQSPAR